MRRIALLALALLTSCGVPFDDRELDRAHIGKAPEREVAIERASARLDEMLRGWDREAAGFYGIDQGFYQLPDRSSRFGWEMRVSFAPLNEHGQRMPLTMYHCYFLNDEVVAVAAPEPLWLGREYKQVYVATEFNGGGKTLYQSRIKRKRAEIP